MPTETALKRSSWPAAALLLVLLVGAGVGWWWQQRTPAAPPISVGPPPAATASAPAAAVAPPTPSVSSAGAVQHPIEPAAEAAAPLDPKAALIDLFGRRAVLSTFQLEDFPRRFAATVDNLGRASAPSRLWPISPSSGQFLVERRDGEEVVSADNGLRYTPFVLMMETVDIGQAVATYRRLYPLFQQAYADLGYPRGYFNDRLVEVIDVLLATPEPASPPAVHLPEIRGPVRPERPWVLYEFDDPALESLASGQKILLRMGPVNERRMKTKLMEIRRLLVADRAGR